MVRSTNARVLRANLTDTFRKLDLPLPALLTDAFAEADRIAASTPTYDQRELSSAVVAAVEAGKDPATDKAVRTALDRRAVASNDVREALEARADEIVTDAATDQAEAIIAALAPVVDAANAPIAEAHVKLKDPQLGQATPPRVSTNLLGVWGDARSAVERVALVARSWQTLVQRTGRGEVDGQGALIVADLDPDDFEHLRQRGAAGVAAAGRNLELATVDGLSERGAKIAEARAKRKKEQDTRERQRMANAFSMVR